MPGDNPDEQDHAALYREVLTLRMRVAELQRAAARHEETEDVSLAEREELLLEAERVMHLGTWTWNRVSGQVTWSDELFRILGYQPGSITPSVEAFFDAVHPEDRARAAASTQQSLQEGILPPVDCRLVRPDGSIRHTTSTSSMLFDADGVPRRLVGGVLDRTDQLHMREELAHAHKMEAVGRLAGGIAHDFNNLLTVATGNLQLFVDTHGLVPELSDSLRALNSAASLTRRLLAFGRKAQLSLKEMDPNELVRSTAAMMLRVLGDEVRIELALGSAVPPIHVDPVEIERALVNLVVNARDAMPEGGVVRMGTRARLGDGSAQVELFVADEGVGVKEADRPHIFEPFFTTRGGAGGNGLGLATVLGTAEQHGGTVRVDAPADGGSIFTIVLPAYQGEAAPQPAPARTEITMGDTPKSLNLLVVDDEAVVADVTRKMLEVRGHSVRVASQPEEALAVWTESGATIDLVICDVSMARIRGPELVQRMAEKGPPPRVLFITGYSEEAVHSELGHPVLGKPFSTSTLWRAVDEITAGLKNP